MIAGQKMIGSNGYENMLFPLSYIYVTQGENGSYSHQGSLAIDFQGYGAEGRVLNCPYYAPFDCKCVKIWGSTSPMIVWESINPVNLVNDVSGLPKYMCIGFVHDDNTESFTEGETRSQGDLIGHTGTYGHATGDHVHIEVAEGKYHGYHQNSQGVWVLDNQYHIYNACGINDTVVVVGYGYDWKSFSDTPVPPTPGTKIKKFPWVLYANKLRKMRNHNTR